ncbi:MAG: type IV toxin-antitoxin system AbiEi family antitoxin domain-containing protein [Candidatus Margulisiibacteriota bacterium]
MPRSGLTEKIRQVAKELGTFRVRDIAERIDIQTYREKHNILSYVSDLKKAGEVERIGKGLYKYVPKKPRRTFLDVIWHLVRSYRQFDTDEIERLSGAARGTVKEYLLCLMHLGYLRREGLSGWALIKDPGPQTPANSAKCARLKRLRGAKE